MNEEDRRLAADEREASPQRFPSSPAAARYVEAQQGEREPAEDLARAATANTLESVSSASSVQREEIRIARLETQRDNVSLSRHPTALSRIQTGRSQHNHTVGSSLRSRTTQRASVAPLPPFGGGKEYPPVLPEREEYVVEFDGPTDPIHAQVS